MKINNGYFDDNKQEYVILNMFPRRKLVNYLWNEETVCSLDHFGCGFSWTKIGYDRKNIDSGERLVFIKDNDNNVTYAVSNMIIGPSDPNTPGYAPMSWISGTAGTLLKVTIENILGIKPTYKGLTIEPCLPSSWNSLEVVRKFRGETYYLHYIRSNENKVECDGKKVNVLPLYGKPSNHDVLFTLNRG